ncbi:trophoblast glycoprotein b isoform X2 [Engraulis encrasicolus]|uniref:trophoblast glycoprotein b isoform X2 n=1 Tax=Engraulis encrasicolus TaxID=184585 RepID=UPI002FD438AD
MRASLTVTQKVKGNQPNLCLWRVYVMVVFLSVVGLSSASACPSKCVCQNTSVLCENMDLTAIPQPLPEDIETLIVTGNNITRLTTDSFPKRLAQLTEVHLTGNHIEEIESGVFYNVPNLSLLDLSDNRIRSVSGEAFAADNTLLSLNLSKSLYSYSYTGELTRLFNNSTPKLSKLDLSNNKMVFLPDSMFTGLPDLAFLDLRNNSIVSVSSETFRNPLLGVLDLRDNALREMSNGTLFDFSANPTLTDIRITDNPWLCDCNIIDMQDWLRKSHQVLDKQSITCDGPDYLKGRLLLQVEPSQLSCNYNGELEGVLETSYVFLGMVLALIGVIFLLVLYLNRKGIKRWMYNIRDACRDHMEGYHYS